MSELQMKIVGMLEVYGLKYYNSFVNNMTNLTVHKILPEEVPGLLEALAAGSETAFQVLYEQYKDQLYRYVLPFARSEVNAEEAVQEVLFKLWARRETLLGITALDRYLYRMARNQVLDILRKETNEQKHRGRLPATYNTRADAEDVFSYKEYHRVAAEAIQLLPQKQQQVFLLRHQADKTMEEIAVLTGMNKEAAQKNLTRAVTAIKKHLRTKSEWLGLFFIFFK